MKNVSIAALVLASAGGAGFLGLGVGYLAADGTPDVETRTVTKEVPVEKVITKEVEVPVVKEVTPEACHEAIAAAEDMGQTSGDFARLTSQYPPLISRAFSAGLTQDVPESERILARMETILGGIKDLNRDVDSIVVRFNTAKAKC